MEVYTFSKNLCRDDDIIVVLPLAFIVGIEVFFNGALHFVTISSCYHKGIIPLCINRPFKRHNRIYSFREDDKFAGCVLLWVKQLRLDTLLEFIKLWVFRVLCPT